MVKTMMIPAAVDSAAITNCQALCLLQLGDGAWDGPAAIAAYADNWVIAGMDRNGSSMRYYRHE